MFDKIKIVYLLGIGGIGMSALARYFNHFGLSVTGYDKTPTGLTDQLQREGIEVHFEDSLNRLPSALQSGVPSEQVLVIYTPAIPRDHKQFNFIREKGFKLYKRSEILGLITQSAKSVTIAGTHGKTTTSTLVAHVIKNANVPVSAFLGGISGNYETNLLLNANATYTIIEADEYDRSFLRLFPYVNVITSMDPDHLDIYGTSDEMTRCYQEFAGQTKPDGIVIHKYGLPLNPSQRKLTYGFDEKADYVALNVTIQNGEYWFDLKTPNGLIREIKVGLPGRHNVENAIAAFAACESIGIDADKIKNGIATYKGVKRRFEYVIKKDGLVFIDDYAHHPEELRACISSVREMYSDKKVLGVFQPHLFSRTRDFADDFAKSLDLLDETVLLEIYPARELPIEGVNASMLLDKMRSSNKKLVTKDELIGYVKEHHKGVVVTLGAGDIDKMVEPLKNALLA